MGRKKILVIFSSLVLFFSANTLLRAEEKKFSIGVGAGLGRCTSGINKYIRVDTLNPIPYAASVSVSDRKIELKDHCNLKFSTISVPALDFKERLAITGQVL